MSNETVTNTAVESIHTARLAVMQEIGYVKKSRANGLNYTFLGETDLLEALRPIMVECGIVFHFSNSEMIHFSEYKTAKGSSMMMAVVKMNWQMIHAPSGTLIDGSSIGQASDSGDKAVAKAITIAEKYALRTSFLIETGDDPDKYASVGAVENTHQQKQSMVKKPSVTAKIVDAVDTQDVDKPVTTEQAKELYLNFIKQYGEPVLSAFGITTMKEIPTIKYSVYKALLNNDKSNPVVEKYIAFTG